MTRKETLLKMLEEDPNNSFLMYAVGKECEQEQNDPQALMWYEKVVQCDPKYTGVYYHIAQVHMRAENLDQARLILNQGIQVCTEAQAHHDLAELKGVLINMDIE